MIKIRILSPADVKYFPDALELLNRTQGRNLFAEDYLLKKTSSEDARVFAAFQEDEVVAIGVAEIIANFDWYSPFDPTLAEYNGIRAGSFSTLCVREDLQGKGIGKAISLRRLEYLKQNSVPFILGVSWVSGKTHTSDRVFEKMNFSAVKKVDHFFKEMSLKKPFECPGCLVHPCICSAILYRFQF